MRKNILSAAIFIALFFSVFLIGSNTETTETKQREVTPTNALLQFTDTTEVFDVTNAKVVTICVVDSSDSKADTIFAFIRGGDTTSTSNVYWSQVALHDVAQTTTTTNVASMIPGDGVTKTYSVVSVVGSGVIFTQLRVVRSNESTNDAYTPRTKIAVNTN